MQQPSRSTAYARSAARLAAVAALAIGACGEASGPDAADLPGNYVLEQWHGSSLPHVYKTGVHQIFTDNGAELVMSDHLITELSATLDATSYQVRGTVVVRPHDDRFAPDTTVNRLLDSGLYSYSSPRIVFATSGAGELFFETATAAAAAATLDVRLRHRIDDSGVATTTARLTLRRVTP